MTNNNSIRANNPQHRPSSPQHNNSNAVQQQTAGTASRTPQPPEEQVFQTPHILNRIIELSDSPKNTTKTLLPVKKSFSAQDLLDAFSQDPQTRNNSILHNYLQNAPKDSPLPDIDITLSPEDLNNNDILSALRYLQSSNTTSPIKAVIVVDTSSELQSLIDNQLSLLQKNPSFFRAINIKKYVSTFLLREKLVPFSKKLQYTTGSQQTPIIKLFPLKISLITYTVNKFLNADFSTLPENLQITQLKIDNGRESWRKEDLTNSQNSPFQQQLNKLNHIQYLNLQIDITQDTTLTIPASVTTFLSASYIYGTLQFAPGSQCATLYLGDIFPQATVTIPPSVKKLTTKGIEGTLLFTPDSHCTTLSIDHIWRSGIVTIPASVSNLTIYYYLHRTLQFSPRSQCSELFLGDMESDSSAIIPPSVTTLENRSIDGTLHFAPDSQCSSLSLGHIYARATVTIPPSVTTLSVGIIKENATVTIPPSVTTLTTGGIDGTLSFAPGSQCSSLSLDYIDFKTTVTIPSSVTTLTTGYIYGTLQFAPGSQCSTLSLDYISPKAPVTIPSSVTTLTIKKTTHTGQQLLDLKSGKTSLPNVTFEQP